MVENRNHDEKMEKKKLIQENKSLRKELAKKEKAFAEMASLYTLKKMPRNFGGKSRKTDPGNWSYPAFLDRLTLSAIGLKKYLLSKFTGDIRSMPEWRLSGLYQASIH